MDSQDNTIEQQNSVGTDQNLATKPEIRGWPEKLQLVLRSSDQPTIAALLLISLLAIAFYMWQQSIIRNGLIDIDEASNRSAEYRIDINNAHWTEIANLPGIGEGTAHAVERYRAGHGPFRSIDEISNVPGIGPKKLEAIREYLLPIRFEPAQELQLK